MASYQKRGKKWRVTVRKDGVSKSRTFSLKGDAESWARKTEISIENEDFFSDSNFTLIDLFSKFLNETTSKGRAQEIRRLRRFVLDFNHLATKKISKFTSLDVMDWRNKRLKSVSSSTVSRDWELLKSIFNKAVYDWGLLNRNPFNKVKKPKKGKPRNVRFSEQEIQEILEALDYTDLKPPMTGKQWTAWAFLFALETACRLSEICKLEKADITEDLIILRNTKNGSNRVVPLSRKAKELLNLVELPVPYPSIRLSYFFSVNKPDHLKHLRFHDTRHEAISRLALKITNHLILAKITGHRDLKILSNTYYNPKDEELVKVFKEMEQEQYKNS